MRKEGLLLTKALIVLSVTLLGGYRGVQAQCNAPTALGATALTTTSASITWTTGGATNWNVEYGPVGFTLGSGTQVNATSTTTTLTGLTSNLAYEFYVRDSCGVDSVSAWAGPQAVSSLVTPCDDFDAYATGLIDPQSTLIEGWAGSGGDGTVSTDYSSSSPNSLKIFTSGSNGYCDMVTDMPTYTSGIHIVKFDFYLPTGYGGYYNILHNYVGSGTNVWAIEVYLNSNGTASVEEGSNGTGVIGTYSFNVGSWNTVEHIINLDDDTAFVKINGNYTSVGWQFSLGSTNYGDQFNAVNFYSTAPGTLTPLTYYDNFCVIDAPVDDVGMVEFIVNPPLCGDSNYAIEAVIENHAENSQTGFDVDIDITGSATASFTYTYNGSLNPGQKDTVVLGTVNNFSGGTYNIAAYTQLSGDTVVSNDTIVANNVVIFPAPVVALGADDSYCDNETFSLQLDAGNSGATYDWSTGGTSQSITVTTAGTYWVEITDANGCTASDTIEVVEYAAPVVSLGADQDYCDNVGISLVLDAGNTGSVYFWSTGQTSQSISVNSAGLYYVVVATLDGCADSDTVLVTELAAPVITLSDVEICTGDTATLDAGNAGSTYVWNVAGETGQTLETPLAGSYAVTVTAANGCVDSSGAVVTVNPEPFVNIGPADTTITLGETLTLDAGNPGDTYAWSTGATTQTIDVTVSGTYGVTVTNQFGCEETDSINVSVVIGVEELYAGAVNLYPNPVSHSASLQLESKAGGDLSVELYSLSGQLVYRLRQGIEGGTQQIAVDMEGLDAGMYILDVKLDNRPVSTMRISKI